MVDRNVIAVKLAELGDRIARLRELNLDDAEELALDRDRLELVSFNLLLAVQSCLDVASHLISDEGWEPAANLAGTFVRLQDHGVLSLQTTAALQKAAGFRNVIAHGYTGADPEKIHRAATRGPADLEAFAREVSTWLDRRPENHTR